VECVYVWHNFNFFLCLLRKFGELAEHTAEDVFGIPLSGDVQDECMVEYFQPGHTQPYIHLFLSYYI
jgi:hypothetical protein